MKDKDNALRKVAKAALFILILFFVLRSMSYVLRTNGDTKDRFAGFYSEEKNSIDVLMFGASTIGASFCAPYMWNQYGFTSYPLSSNSQRTVAYKYLIEEGLRYQQPSVIVIEMRTFFGDFEEMATDEGHIREVVDNMKYSWHRIETINAVADHFDDKWPFYIDIMKYHSNIGMLLQPTEWKKAFFKTNDNNKGFVIRNMAEGYRTESVPESINEKRTPLDTNQEATLVELLKYLKDNNFEALFVVVPRDDEDDYQAVMNYAGDIVREYGFDYLDMNYCYDEMQFDFRTDINDGAHTNVWGALKCSDLLGKYLVEHYDINMSHDEKTIKNWDNAYDYFYEQYKNTEVKERSYDD